MVFEVDTTHQGELNEQENGRCNDAPWLVLRQSFVLKIMGVLGISFMIILCLLYVLHLWFVMLAVSGLRTLYELFLKYFCFCLCFFSNVFPHIFV